MFLKEELNLKFLPHLKHLSTIRGLCQASGDQHQIRFKFQELHAISRSLENSVAAFADRPPRQGDHGAAPDKFYV